MPEALVEVEETETPAQRKLHAQTEESLIDYLGEIAAEIPIKVTVVRKVPKTWQGRTIEGTLDTFDEPISVDQLRELYGGGSFALRIQKFDDKSGKFKFFTQRTIKIAGDPKLDALITTGGNRENGGAPPDVVKNALSMAERVMNKADERAQRAEQRGPDPSISMLQMQLEGLQETIARKDDQIFALLNKKPESSSTDTILGKMLDGESSRMQGLRMQVESEIRTINERHTAEINRLHDRYEAQAERAEKAHNRELEGLTRNYESQMATMKLSYEGQMEGFKRELGYVSLQLETAQKELATLRATKDKGPVEHLTELKMLKEAFDGFGGEDKGGGTAERIISGIMESPLVEGIGSRLAMGAATGVAGADPNMQQAHQQEAQSTIDPNQLEMNKPVQLSDGRIVVKRSDGNIYQIKKKAGPPAPTGEDVNIDPNDIKVAVQFMEGACANDVDPAQFASTARSIVPASIIKVIRAQGVDEFLAKVAKIEDSSILNSQKGRNWVRKVATILLG